MADTVLTYVADRELAALLKAAARAGERLRIVADDETYELDVNPMLPEDNLWRDYDPEAAREAWRASAGILKDIDPDVLIRELKAEREQDTVARPAS